MATCPKCRVHGYPPDDFSLTDRLEKANGLIGGTGLKFTARRVFILACLHCAWSVEGQIGQDGNFYAAKEVEE